MTREPKDITKEEIDGLDPGCDDGVEQAWDAEIARRVAEIESGTVRLIPWSEVRRRIEKTLKR
jgi:putative addiction module component (TIGR02574 family)